MATNRDFNALTSFGRLGATNDEILCQDNATTNYQSKHIFWINQCWRVEAAPEGVEAAPEGVEAAPEDINTVEAAPEGVEAPPEGVEAAPEDINTFLHQTFQTSAILFKRLNFQPGPDINLANFIYICDKTRKKLKLRII